MTNLIPNKPRYWLACHPDLSKPIGGVKQIHRLGEALNICEREATIIQGDHDFHPGWFKSSVKTTSLFEWSKRKDLSESSDIVILPETYLPNYINYPHKLPTIIFNQNGYYSFGLEKTTEAKKSPTEIIKLYENKRIIHVLCVSTHDRELLINGLGLKQDNVSLLINAIETNVFRPDRKKIKQIAFMPRKNPNDSLIVKSLINNQRQLSSWRMVPIDKFTQGQVANILQESLVFMSFGFPEGFGLPLAEAAACGCALIGYSGLGGREIIRLAEAKNTGWEVEFGDWNAFLSGLLSLEKMIHNNHNELQKSLMNVANTVRTSYSYQAMINSIRQALPRWESKLIK